MYDVVTFGSATNDIFLKLKTAAFQGGKEICFGLGSKIFVDDLEIFSGGGGTNAACTFANQGLKTAYLGKIGDDSAGNMVVDEIRRFKVSTVFLQKDVNRKTAVSVILSFGKERTIFVYQGACHFITKEDIPWFNGGSILLRKPERRGVVPKAKWFYIAPLYDKSAKLLKPLVKFAKENKIKIALNPGKNHIQLGLGALKPILSQVDVLILNIEEAGLLVNTPSSDELIMMKKLANVCPGIVVVTKGIDGSVVGDGKYIFEAGVPSLSVIEKTGAGDAFGSGFVAGLIQKNNIEYAIQLATANATSCIQKVGAKNGLLKKGEWGPWPKVEVKRRH